MYSKPEGFFLEIINYYVNSWTTVMCLKNIVTLVVTVFFVVPNKCYFSIIYIIFNDYYIIINN